MTVIAVPYHLDEYRRCSSPHYRTPAYPPVTRSPADPPNPPPNALNSGFHGVRTPWIRGFMAFQRA